MYSQLERYMVQQLKRKNVADVEVQELTEISKRTKWLYKINYISAAKLPQYFFHIIYKT